MKSTDAKIVLPISLAMVALCLVVSRVAFAASPTTKWDAAEWGAAGQIGFMTAAWIIPLVAYLLRRQSIGGWLLVYFLQLYGGVFLAIGMFGGVYKDLAPSQWNSAMLYILFLLSYLPTEVVYVLELFAATWLLVTRTRDRLRFLRLILIYYVIGHAVSVSLHVAFFRETAVFLGDSSIIAVNILGSLFAIIWCIYFHRSRRVQMVFVERTWKYEDLRARQALAPDQKRKLARRVVVAAVATYVVLLLLFASEWSKPDAALFVLPLVYAMVAAGIAWVIPVRHQHKGDDVARSDTKDSTNKRGTIQKAVLVLGASATLVAVLFPPFVIYHPTSGIAYNSGFSFLFSSGSSLAVVNVSLLALELVAIVVITAILLLLFRRH